MPNSLEQLLMDRRLLVVLGPYGSGKTEVSLNLALWKARQGLRTALCDLDIVNPYFRSREREALLEAEGVRLIAPSAEFSGADLPALPGDILVLFHNESLHGIIDAGGDPVGARVLSAYHEDMEKAKPYVLFVYNRARLGPESAREALQKLQLIEAQGRLTVHGILNNTHLLHDTDKEVLAWGLEGAEELSRLSGLPLLGTTAREDLVKELPEGKVAFPLTLHMHRPWEGA